MEAIYNGGPRSRDCSSSIINCTTWKWSQCIIGAAAPQSPHVQKMRSFQAPTMSSLFSLYVSYLSFFLFHNFFSMIDLETIDVIVVKHSTIIILQIICWEIQCIWDMNEGYP